MANPKRRHSKSRRDKRRANWKLTPPELTTCPKCKSAKLPHAVCPECGYYKDELVIEKKSAKEEKKEKPKKEKKAKKDKKEKKEAVDKKGLD